MHYNLLSHRQVFQLTNKLLIFHNESHFVLFLMILIKSIHEEMQSH